MFKWNRRKSTNVISKLCWTVSREAVAGDDSSSVAAVENLVGRITQVGFSTVVCSLFSMVVDGSRFLSRTSRHFSFNSSFNKAVQHTDRGFPNCFKPLSHMCSIRIPSNIQFWTTNFFFFIFFDFWACVTYLGCVNFKAAVLVQI